MSVLDVEGRAGQVLRGLGVDLAGLRAAVEGGRDDISSPAAGTTARREKASPTCGNCGSPLETTLAHRTMPSASSAGADRPLFVVAFCSACGSAVGASPL